MKIWCLLRDQHSHVRPVEAALRGDGEFVYDETWDPNRLVEASPDLVLCVNEFQSDVALCLEEARRCSVPSLTMQDGILEWRCQYENPLFAAGGGPPQHQPVLADKIACLGPHSARQIGAWGNGHKVEITGMPRLDHLAAVAPPPPHRPGTRLLIMTAKNPGFTPEQRARTLASLRDMKSFVTSQPGIEVVWRLSMKIAADVGIENELQTTSSEELASILGRVDAVVTTPSTAMLEAMVLGRPVAALDYHNVPRFVPTAWTITAREHIAPIVGELLNPVPAKVRFQEDCLRDCLLADGQAADRVGGLIREMVWIGQDCRKRGHPLRLPERLARWAPSTGYARTLDLSVLYPEEMVFQDNDCQRLQLMVVRLRGENARLQEMAANRSLGSILLSRIYGRWKSARLRRKK